MKKYQNEQEFITTFAKDAKESLKSGQNFEAEVNDITVVVTNMDNNNSSKVTIYKGSVDGVSFNGSITALKKRLNITYTKEYNRTGVRAQAANTKVTIKSDDELAATAATAAKRIMDAINVLKQASSKYGLSRADMLERTDSVEAVILETLIRQRDRAAQERADKEAKAAEEAAKREATKRRLLDDLSAASANGDMAEVMRLSKALKNYM